MNLEVSYKCQVAGQFSNPERECEGPMIFYICDHRIHKNRFYTRCRKHFEEIVSHMLPKEITEDEYKTIEVVNT